MKNKTKKTLRLKGYEKGDFEADEKRRVKRTIFIPVDFQRLEEAPITKVDREIQARMAAGSTPLDCSMDSEHKSLLREAIEKSPLSKVERLCVELTMGGEKPDEISCRLGVDRSSVRVHLKRATRKIKNYVHLKFGLKK